MSDKIRKYVLPNLPYLFVFWFFSKIGTAYRIAPGTDFGTKLMGMLDTFPKAFETYWPGLGGIDLLVGLAGAAGVYLLIQSKIRKAKKFRRDAEYGTARFGTKEDIKPFVDPNPVLFSDMVLNETLYEHCAEIEETAKKRMEIIVPQLAKAYGVTEQLKAENQIEWVRQMNACVAQAEEAIKGELIYC